MEAIWVAAEMRAGGTYAHSVLALDVIAREEVARTNQRQVIAIAPDAGDDMNGGSEG